MPRRRILVSLSVAGLLVVIALAVAIDLSYRPPGDARLLQVIQSIPAFGPVASFFDIAVHYTLIPLAIGGLALLLLRRRAYGQAAVFALFYTGAGLLHGMRLIIDRQRPGADAAGGETAFPSGHAFDAAAFAVLISLAATWYMPARRWRLLVYTLSALFVVVAGAPASGSSTTGRRTSSPGGWRAPPMPRCSG